MAQKENRRGSLVPGILCLLMFGVCLVLLFLVLDLKMKCRQYEVQINSLKTEITGLKQETGKKTTDDPEILTSVMEKTETASSAGAEAAMETVEAKEPAKAEEKPAVKEPQTASESVETEAAALKEAAALVQTTAAPAEEAAALVQTTAPPAEETAEIREPAELPKIEELQPGTVLDAAAVKGREDAMFAAFGITEGDAVYNRINGKSYRENPNIGISDLRYLKMIHYNFEHQIQVGEMIVNQGIAEDVLHIFRELYDIEYEIQSMYLIDNYWTGDGDSSDTASIEVNNTSSFCYRTATGSGNLSNHAYGRAIDLNPQQNPYVWYDGNGNLRWSHSNADPYIDRGSGDPHMVVAGDACYNIFIKYGFSWGGEWSNPIDYQHFEKRG